MVSKVPGTRITGSGCSAFGRQLGSLAPGGGGPSSLRKSPALAACIVFLGKKSGVKDNENIRNVTKIDLTTKKKRCLVKPDISTILLILYHELLLIINTRLNR